MSVYLCLSIYWVALSITGCILFQQTALAKPECSRRLYARNNTGVIVSYNYPFDYRTSIDCEYNIQLEETSSLEKEICFTFHRFDLEACSETALHDYLQFQDNTERYIYCSHGQLYNKEGVPEKWLTVWNNDFCWPVNGSEFNLLLVSDLSGVGRGFYASYEVKPASSVRKTTSKAPCQDIQWTCFDRGCINSAHVCDEKFDCSDGSDEMYSHSRCLKGPYSPSVLACDFNSNCGFTGIGYYDGWLVESSSDFTDRGPTADHTRGDVYEGKYARTEFKSQSHLYLFDDTGLLDHLDYCLSFWYHMWGPDPGKLQVLYGDPDMLHSILPLWNRDGSYGNKWHHAEVFIPKEKVTELKRIIFLATRSGDQLSQIALDDISVSSGECFGDDLGCNFALDMCGWEVEKGSPDNPDTWERASGKGSEFGPFNDASNNPVGSYMMYYKHTATELHSEDHLVTSPVIINGKDTSHTCLTMAYYLNGSTNTANIKVALELLSGHKATEITIHAAKAARRKWTRVSVDIQFITNPFRIKIRPEFIGYPMVLGLDEIAVIQGNCENMALGSCGPNGFRCHNGDCISQDLVCNNQYDCRDASDETHEACELRCLDDCGTNQYCCATDVCIADTKYCNGYNDCGDWSDENSCTVEHNCLSPMFWCDFSGRCIQSDYVCNDEDDCGNYQDEKDCGSTVPVIGIVGIVFGILAILFLLVATVGRFVFRNIKHLPCESSDSDDASENNDTVPQTNVRVPEFESPPSYYRTLNHPEIYTRTDGSRSELSTAGALSVASSTVSPDQVYTSLTDLPPSYARIESGEYIVAANTSREEIDRIKQEVIRRSRNTLDELPKEEPPPYTRIASAPNILADSTLTLTNDGEPARNAIHAAHRRSHLNDTSSRVSQSMFNLSTINTASGRPYHRPQSSLQRASSSTVLSQETTESNNDRINNNRRNQGRPSNTSPTSNIPSARDNAGASEQDTVDNNVRTSSTMGSSQNSPGASSTSPENIPMNIGPIQRQKSTSLTNISSATAAADSMVPQRSPARPRSLALDSSGQVSMQPRGRQQAQFSTTGVESVV